jgi:cell division protein FtsX
MKFALQTLVTLVGCSIVQYFLPWWTMAVIALMAGYVFHNGGTVSFAAGFLGAGALWLMVAYYMDYTTQSILTEKVNKLFPLNVLVMTPVIGGLVGGFAALTGTLMRGKKLARY